MFFQLCCEPQISRLVRAAFRAAGTTFRAAWRLAGRAERVGLSIFMNDVATVKEAVIEAALNGDDFVLVDEVAAPAFPSRLYESTALSS